MVPVGASLFQGAVQVRSGHEGVFQRSPKYPAAVLEGHLERRNRWGSRVVPG